MSATMSKIIVPVSEIFGPTIQGEGMLIGRKTMFLRTAGCDYSCSWCDSSFTWDGSEKAAIMTPEEIVGRMDQLGPDNYNHVTITGGNPGLIGKGIDSVIDLLHAKGVAVGVETQGSKYQDWFLKVDDLVLSPKPPSSNMVTDFEKLDFIVNRVSNEGGKLSIKIVIFTDDDYQYAIEVHKRYPDIAFFMSVGNVEPYSVSDGTERLLNGLRELCEKVINDTSLKDVRLLLQLHTLIWGNKREV